MRSPLDSMIRHMLTPRAPFTVLLALTLLVFGGACEEHRKTTGSCASDSECEGGICFESECCTVCAAQHVCGAGEHCVVETNEDGEEVRICQSASSHTGCGDDADCAGLVAGPCERISCDVAVGTCAVDPAPEGLACVAASGASGACKAGRCEAIDEDVSEEDAAEPEEDIAEPEPDTAEPEPDTAEPEPDVAEPKEDTAEPAPDIAEPAPDVAEPEWDMAEPEEDTTEPESDTAEPEQDVAESLEEEVTEPEEEVTEPEEEVTEPEADVAEPEDVTPEEVTACTEEYEACDQHDQCCSGACVQGITAGMVCAQACPADCPPGWVCGTQDVGVEPRDLCLATLSCDDGVACTVDAYDADTDACTSTPDDGVCDDEDPCTGLEACDAVAGCLVSVPVMDGTCALPCGPDEFEPNDDRESAPLITAGVVPWLTACVDDEDYFQVTAGNNELIEVFVRFEDAIGDVNLWLYDQDMRLLASATSASDDEHLAHTAGATGVYFIRVQLNPANDDVDPGNFYALEVWLGEPCSDAFEDNDALETPAALTAGVHEGLSACPGDLDVYALEAGPNELIVVDAAFEDALGDVDLRLYDPEGALVGSSITNSDDERVVHTTAMTGAYVLLVELDAFDPDDDGPGNQYDLTVSLGELCTDAFEDNDERALAAPIEPGVHAGLTACPGDEDYYAFEVNGDDLIELEVAAPFALGDVDLVLLDPSGAKVAQSIGHADVERVVHTAQASGTYTAQVVLDLTNGDDAQPGNSYELTLSPLAPCTDVFEDNDSQDAAWLLGGGSFTGLRACPDDADYYGVPVVAGETLAVDLAFTDAAGDLRLILLSPSGATLVTAQTAGDGEHAEHVASETGVHLVRVELGEAADDDDTPGNGYDMTISGVAACAPLTSCALQEAECGQVHDGCGVIEPCGDCSPPYFCGLDLKCDCTPTSCAAEGAACGPLHDGCGVELDCGDCVVPEVCGGAYVDNHCAAPTCVADPFEDDDSVEAATLITEGSYQGMIICADDDDYYAFDLNPNELIEVTASFTHAAGDVDLRLLDPAGGLVRSSTTNSDDEYVVYTTLATGVHTLRVSQDTSAGDDALPGNRYSLEVLLGAACTDAYEDNDALEAAAPLAAGVYPGLRACPNDSDFYGITAGNNEIIEIDARFEHALGDLDLRLYDPSGALVRSATSNNDNERVVYTTLVAGAYTIGVQMDGYAADGGEPGNDYELTIALGAPCVDVFEDNDAAGRATPLGSGTFSGLWACPNDEDHYWLSVELGEVVTVDLDFSHAAGDVDLRLYNPGGGLVASSTSNGDDEHVSHTAAVAGDYRVLVALDGYAVDDDVPGNTYTMTIVGAVACAATTSCDEHGAECGLLHDGCGVMLDCGDCADGAPCSDNLLCACTPTTCVAAGATCGMMPDGCGVLLPCGDCVEPQICGGAYVDFQCAEPTCVADVYEEDDTIGEATLVDEGYYSGMIVCSGDDDYYSLVVGNNETITARAIFTHAEGDVDLRLYNPDGGIVASSTSNSDDEQLTTSSLMAGAYSLRVNLDAWAGDDALPGNRYELDLAFGQPCVDQHEDNETLETAAPLVGGSHPGLWICPGDEDWYELLLSNNEFVALEAHFIHAEGDMDMRLYNARGVIVASATSNSDDERIVYTTSESGRFYLRVNQDAWGGDDATPGNEYELVLGLGTACTDVYEDNDTSDDAAAVAGGTHADLSACPADEDWYAVTVGGNELIDALLTFTDATGDVDLRLYDATVTQVASATTDSDDERIVYTTPQAGVYYLRAALDGYDGASLTAGNPYSMTLGLGAACTDTFEDNDALDAPAPLTPGIHPQLMACPYDEDYYALDLNAGDALQVDARFVHASGDVDLRLYSPAGAQVAKSLSNSDDESLSYAVTAAGAYVLKVALDPYAADDEVPGNGYELEVGVTQ